MKKCWIFDEQLIANKLSINFYTANLLETNSVNYFYNRSCFNWGKNLSVKMLFKGPLMIFCCRATGSLQVWKWKAPFPKCISEIICKRQMLYHELFVFTGII